MPYDLIIECQGEQHFAPTYFSPNTTENEAKINFEKQIQRDLSKYQFISDNGYSVIYFTIPFYFRGKNINVDIEFYKDKVLLTEIDKLINLIKNYGKKKN